MQLKRYIATTTVEGLIGIDIMTLQDDLMLKHGDEYDKGRTLLENLETLEGAKTAQELRDILQRHSEKLQKILTAMPV
jgi:hypothetical protein